MPRTCSVCSDSRRLEIDRAIHSGIYTSEIARRFGFSKPTITGHRRSAHHLLQTPRQRDSRQPHTAASLLKRIEANLDDGAALGDLRIAASTLPHGERRLLVQELRLRAGRGVVAEHVPVSRRVAA